MRETDAQVQVATAPRPYFRQVLALTLLASLLFGWLIHRTEVVFADGLRYITQAKAFAQGRGIEGLKAIDHPVYPLAIAAAHSLFGQDSPESWQVAAQLVSAIAGLLLAFPLYLVVRELFGEATALPACALFYAIPLTGHVFADALSESTFLLFWTWGLWACLRFLRRGLIGWVPLIIACSALAYLSRPEGLLLPAALVGGLILDPGWVARGLRGRKAVMAVAVLVTGCTCLIGPYVRMKGGIGTKPSIARLLGTAPRSAAHAVERQRPLDPDQTVTTTYLLAVRAVGKAVADAVSLPLLPLAVLGLWKSFGRGKDVRGRQWRFVAVIGTASVLALVRLHATGGYCSPRHAMILVQIFIPAAVFGLLRVIAMLSGRFGAYRTWECIAVGLIGVVYFAETLAPVNGGMGGYRQAGIWLAQHERDGSRVIDVTGWSQFYGERSGYTFENLIAAPGDPAARWVVVRAQHLLGPWEYCSRLRRLVEGLEPVHTFEGRAGRRTTQVYLYDRHPLLAGAPDPAAKVRR